jgi:hypothetical protein
MARNLSGASQRMVSGNTIGTALSNFSIFIEARRNSITSESYAAGLGSASNVNCHIGFRGDTGGDPIQGRAQNGGAAAGNVGSYSADVWDRCTFTFAAGNGFDIYDGATKANFANSPSYTPSSASLAYLGSFQDGSALLAGMVAKFALWKEQLTIGEAEALAAGFSPRRIRPQSRIAYCPLIRGLGDLHGLFASWTEFGSPTVYDHPRSYGI